MSIIHRLCEAFAVFLENPICQENVGKLLLSCLAWQRDMGYDGPDVKTHLAT
jgi:hypothetical protein